MTKKEIEYYNGPVFYMSHHEVLKPESKTTPCRIALNSSANFHGHVLNEYYAKGPGMLNNLLGVLLRFREEPVAMIGDIAKMFHSINIVGGAVASWLVRSTSERAVRVRALAGDIVLCSWARHFTLTVPLSTQVYKWVPANLMLGVTLRWTSIPSRGE